MSGTDDRDGLASTVAAEEAGLASTVVGEPSDGGKADPFARTTASGDPPGEANVQVGGSVGRYRLEEVIGSGGMGVVYRAFDDTLGRRVAVKVMRGDRDDHERLLREARTMAQLAHPGVVPVLDVVETERGDVHIVMELVEGGTLGKWLRGARRPWAEVLARFAPAGRALADAHKAGVIHRDFKPDNVLLARDGRVLVSDFGLARGAVRKSGFHAVQGEPQELDLTQSGAMMGTPAYMAPEQFRGDDVDGRCDQFAFCVSIWEGLFGERPFAVDAGTSPKSALDSLKDEVLSGRRRAAPRDRDVPARLTRALERGLETDPAARWPDMPALLAELDAIRAPRPRTPLIAAAVIGVAGAGILAAVMLTRGGSSAKQIDAAVVAAATDAGRPDAGKRARVTPHRVAKAEATLILPSGFLRDVHVSADGATALASPDHGEVVRFTAAGVQPVIAGADRIIIGATFGADGAAYAITREQDGVHARLIGADGALGDGPLVTTGPATGAVGIGPDSATVAVATQAGVALRVPAGERWQVPATDVRALAISPDGAWVAMASVEAGAPILSLLAIADGATAAREVLTSGDLPSLAWLDDVIVVTTRRDLDSYVLEEVAVDGGKLRRLGPVQVGNGLPLALAAGGGVVAIATSGSRPTLVRGTPGAMTARAMAGDPRVVLGGLSDGAIAVMTTAATIVAVAADGSSRELTAPPAGCVPIGTWKDQISCAMPGTPVKIQAGAQVIAELSEATSITRGACTPDAARCAFAGMAANGDPETWLVEAGQVPRKLGIGGVGDGTVAMSNGGTVATAGCDEIIMVREPAGQVREIEITDGVTCAAAFLDDERLAIAVMDFRAATWLWTVRVADGSVIDKTPAPVELVQSIAAAGGEVAIAGAQVATRVERLTLSD